MGEGCPIRILEENIGILSLRKITPPPLLVGIVHRITELGKCTVVMYTTWENAFGKVLNI